jgi:hypothetical protein
MATLKNINSDYTINCNVVAGNAYGTFRVNAANIILSGNITNVNPSVTTEPFLIIGANNTGSITDLGVLTQTGLSSVGNVAVATFAGLRFDSTVNAWQISPQVAGNGAPIAAYANIVSGNTTPAGGANTQVQYNANGFFSGSYNLAFDYANTITPQLTLGGAENFVNIGANAQSNLNPIANTTVVFSNPPQAGNTGLYFISPSVAGEVISASKALLYSLIF